MKLHFACSVDLSQLHDEILAACPAVCAVEGQAQMFVEGDGSNVWLTLPDELDTETQQQVEAIVSNHTPAPGLQPDWAGFRSQVGSHAAYLRLASEHPRNMVLNVQLTALLWRIGDDPSLFGEVAGLWGAMVGNVPLTAIEVSQLNAIAVACNVPLRLDELGRMTAS